MHTPGNGATASTFRAMRHRNFRLWFFGQLTSLVGTWMQTIAQNWLVYQLTGSARDLGLVNFVGAIPLVPLTLYAGAIADRFSKRKIIFAMQAAMMVQAFLLFALCWAGVVQVWHVMALAFLLGAAQALDTPARQAFVVELVGKEDLSNAIALNSGIFHGARVIGPAVAGILVAYVGVSGAFFLNGASFLAVLGGLFLMDASLLRRARAGGEGGGGPPRGGRGIPGYRGRGGGREGRGRPARGGPVHPGLPCAEGDRPPRLLLGAAGDAVPRSGPRIRPGDPGWGGWGPPH